MRYGAVVLQILPSQSFTTSAMEGVSVRRETESMTGRRSGWQTGGESFINRRSILTLAVVSLTWAFSLMVLPRFAPVDLSAGVTAWALACPNCGTVESVATSSATRRSGELVAQLYRLTIRMADGSIRQLERVSPITPGAQVRVQNDVVWPLAPTHPNSAPTQ